MPENLNMKALLYPCRKLPATLVFVVLFCSCSSETTAPKAPAKATAAEEGNKVATSAKAINGFWQWFEKNSVHLSAFEQDQEKVFGELDVELGKVNKGLRFEFGPVKNGQREFAISANGIVEVFPAVNELVSAAPKLANWRIIAFRQPKEGLKDFKLEFEGVKMTANDLWFKDNAEGDKVGLILYIRGFKSDEETQALAGASFLFLDMAIGEYFVVTRIGSIDRRPLPEDPRSLKLKPLGDLKEIVASKSANH